MSDEKKVTGYEPLASTYEPVVGVNGAIVQQDPNQTLKGVVSGRPMFGSVDIDLNANQTVVGDGGTLLWMQQGMKMETEIFNGCMAGCGRACAGESCCMNKYTALQPSKIGFGFPMPGDMMGFAVVPGGGWVLAQGAFIAGTENLHISGRFAGCCATAFAGTGAFLTHVTVKEGSGMFYAGNFGAITRHDIGPGQVFLVDDGLFFAAHESTHIGIQLLGGLKTALCSGEGFVMRFVGPASIFTQNRDPKIFKRAQQQNQQQQ